MMTKRVGIRELVRNIGILDECDYVEVEDKKTHEYKGLFVSAKYADELKSIIDAKKEKEHHLKLQKLEKFAGKGKIDERFEGLSSSQIKKKIADEK